MPIFSQYVDVEAEIEVDVNEFLSECSEREIKWVIEALIEDGYLNENSANIVQSPNVLDIEWNDIISKLATSRLQLTSAEEKYIKLIADRL